MGGLKIVSICFIGLSFLQGGIKCGKIMKDDCSSRFLTSLIEAGYEIDNTVDLTLNLKYEDVEGVKKKAAIKLRDQCKEPKILCAGETDVINGEIVAGPLLSCSWKWDENDETTKNFVIVRLNNKKAIEISGSVSRGSEKVFPQTSDKGPLNFKFTSPNWNGEDSKRTHRVKRQEEAEDEEENDRYDYDLRNPSETLKATTTSSPPPPPPPTTTSQPEITTQSSPSKAQSSFQLTYLLWTVWASFLVFAVK